MHSIIATLLAAVAFASSSAPDGAYDYRQGGENWNTVYSEKANNICGLATSKQQSPIDLPTSGPSLVEDKDLNIAVEGLDSNSKAWRDFATTNMETNWQLTFGSWTETATVTRTDGANESASFTPLQIHWHTPSEHTVNGVHYAAEAHLVS